MRLAFGLANLMHVFTTADEGAATDLGDRYLVAADVAVILLTDFFYSHCPKPPFRLPDQAIFSSFSALILMKL